MYPDRENLDRDRQSERARATGTENNRQKWKRSAERSAHRELVNTARTVFSSSSSVCLITHSTHTFCYTKPLFNHFDFALLCSLSPNFSDYSLLSMITSSLLYHFGGRKKRKKKTFSRRNVPFFRPISLSTNYHSNIKYLFKNSNISFPNVISFASDATFSIRFIDSPMMDTFSAQFLFPLPRSLPLRL